MRWTLAAHLAAAPLAFFVLASLTACAPSGAPAGGDAGGGPAEVAKAAKDSGGLSAPTPEGYQSILQSESGGTVETKVGAKLAVELTGTPTAGYVWMGETIPAFLKATGERTGDTTAAQSQPGFTGGNHWEVLLFEVVAEGEGELLVVKRRPWETNTEPVETFKVTIKATK
jgi:inhibitor of cysteine peptidase